MNQWINQFLENEIVNRTDKADKADKADKPKDGGPLSVLSVRTPVLLDEKLEKVENNPETGTDKTDKPINEGPLSVLSVRTLRLLDENLEKVKNNPETGTDKTDKPTDGGPLSVLSVRPPGLLDENLVNMPEPDRLGPNFNLSGLSGRLWGLLEEKVENNPSKGGDKSARFKFEANMSSPHEGRLLSVLSVPPMGPFAETSFYPLDATSLLNEYQERLAIAEYDGLQNPLQAERIAYLDAFMAVLVTLPYKDVEGDWLFHRIKAAQEWLSEQRFVQPK